MAPARTAEAEAAPARTAEAEAAPARTAEAEAAPETPKTPLNVIGEASVKAKKIAEDFVKCKKGT